MWWIRQKLQLKKVNQEEPAFIEQEEVTSEKPESEEIPPELPKKITNQELIIMHIMAPKDKFYSGYELLQTLLSNGFRFGDMNIFHNYEKPNNEGKILFSLARATEPGTFDIRNMGSCSCSGLTIFMRLNDHKNPLQIFNNMFETAKKLVDDLGGEIWSESQKIDQSIIEKWRNKIKNYENSLYTYDLFE
jgi:cell division protein ZipA